MPGVGSPSQEIVEGHREDVRWKHSRASSVKWSWKKKSMEAVLEFLRDTRVGCMVTMGKPQEEELEQGRGARARRAGRASPCNVPSFVFFFRLFRCLFLSSFSLSFSFVFFFVRIPLCQAATGGRRPGSPTRPGDAGLGQVRNICKRLAAIAQVAAKPLPRPFGLHVTGY